MQYDQQPKTQWTRADTLCDLMYDEVTIRIIVFKMFYDINVNFEITNNMINAYKYIVV